MLFGANVPVPEVDQNPPLAFITEPLIPTLEISPQTIWSLPAETIGAGDIVIII